MKFRTGWGRDPDTVYLSASNWDDWFEFETLHHAYYIDRSGEERPLGAVKIGEFGLLPGVGAERRPGVRRPTLPNSFENLGENFFSLGQDTDYYENLKKLGTQFRETYLRATNDIAFDSALRERALQERVTSKSLMRELSLRVVQEQFARLAHGGERVVNYDFNFPVWKDPFGPELTFAVRPSSRPPTNIHVLIGRNGVGKSTTLNFIAHMMMGEAHELQLQQSVLSQRSQLSNVVSVSFSAFDEFEPIRQHTSSEGLAYNYVGLRQIRDQGDASDSDEYEWPEEDGWGELEEERLGSEDQIDLRPRIKNPSELATELTEAVDACLRMDARRARLERALGILEGDPMFSSYGVRDLIRLGDPVVVSEELPGIFGNLSSGHKIVLLSISKLVQTVQEKTLVLIDEPEAHLHPPLLSAFIRALSDLLTDRNGLAIVATHSPVVLQEVPKSCVWKLNNVSDRLVVERPQLETFGENVGTLTDEIFGLEVTATGFHTMLDAVANETRDYQAALREFDGQLGTEGRAILRTMIAAGWTKGSDVGR